MGSHDLCRSRSFFARNTALLPFYLFEKKIDAVFKISNYPFRNFSYLTITNGKVDSILLKTESYPMPSVFHTRFTLFIIIDSGEIPPVNYNELSFSFARLQSDSS